MNWDDLRIVLAVSRTNHLEAAAEVLQVNPSTVFRRLKQIEKDLGVQLFQRLPSGYVLTPEGQALVQVANTTENGLDGFAASLHEADRLLSGRLRLTVVPDALEDFLLPAVQQFLEDHKRVELDINITEATLNLDRFESEVAVRAIPKVNQSHFGYVLRSFDWVVVASKKYLKQHGRPGNLRTLGGHTILLGFGALERSSQLSKLEALAREQNCRILRFSAISTIRHAVKQGLGIAMVPRFPEVFSPDFELLFEPSIADPELLWIGCHRQLANRPLVREFIEHIYRNTPKLDTLTK